MLPSVNFQKSDFQTGSVAPSPVGVCAFISSAAQGPINVPSSYARDDLAYQVFGPSPLVELGSYGLQQSGKPVMLIRSTASTAAAYATITRTMTGTSVPSAGVTPPADAYPVLVTFVNPGVVGVAGITYTYSLDDGVTTSAIQALPATSPALITIPNFPQGGSPGVSFSMAAGTIVAGDTFSCLTTPAQSTNADVAAALEGLRTTTAPWEGVLIDQAIGVGSVALADAWLIGLERVGKFRFAVLNTRLKNQLDDGTGVAETETAYQTAMQTLVAGQAPSIRLVVGADGGDVASTLTGLVLPRPASLGIAARAMAIPIGVDPAYVGAGPLSAFTISDNGNPAFHNEELYPNLDDLLLSTLRSVQGQSGVYVTNARAFSTVGSDYVFLPHIRTMNRGCEIAWAILTKQLGLGVGKKPADPSTGGVYIQEADALVIDGLVNTALITPMANQVQKYAFRLSRTDDLSANSGATLNGTLTIVALAYVKTINVIAAFTKTIAVAA